MISLYFTTTEHLLSKAIRHVLDTDCSHFAVGFDCDKPRGIVFHSSFFGGEVKFYREFLEKNKVIHELIYRLPLDVEEKIFQALINEAYEKPYDYPAFVYHALRVLGKKYLGIPHNSFNAWQKKQAFICTEVYTILAESYPRLPAINVDLLEPHELFEKLVCAGNFHSITSKEDSSS